MKTNSDPTSPPPIPKLPQNQWWLAAALGIIALLGGLTYLWSLGDPANRSSAPASNGVDSASPSYDRDRAAAIDKVNDDFAASVNESASSNLPGGAFQNAHLSTDGTQALLFVDGDAWNAMSSQDQTIAEKWLSSEAFNSYDDHHLAPPADGIEIKIVDRANQVLYDETWHSALSQ